MLDSEVVEAFKRAIISKYRCIFQFGKAIHEKFVVIVWTSPYHVFVSKHTSSILSVV